MTQLISNVLMQPKPDAVERPLTLIEKLEQKIESLENSFKQSPIVNDEIATVHASIVAGLKMAINIVKQHSDWVSVEEELPVLEYECGFRSFEPTKFYQLIDNEGGLHNAYFSTNHYPNDDRALFTLCELDFYNGKWIVDDEYEVITVNMVKFWKPLQPPSGVQE